MEWIDNICQLLGSSVVSPYFQLAIVVIILFVFITWHKFSEGELMGGAIKVFFGWMPVSVILSWFADSYWLFLLHWFLSVILYFAIWFAGMQLCNNYGRRYTGDGGMVMILPFYYYPITVALSLIVKFILWLANGILQGH